MNLYNAISILIVQFTIWKCLVIIQGKSTLEISFSKLHLGLKSNDVASRTNNLSSDDNENNIDVVEKSSNRNLSFNDNENNIVVEKEFEQRLRKLDGSARKIKRLGQS